MHFLGPAEGVDPAVLGDQPTFLRLGVHNSHNPRGFAEWVPPVRRLPCKTDEHNTSMRGSQN